MFVLHVRTVRSTYCLCLLFALLPLPRELVRCSRDATFPALLGDTFRGIGQRGEKVGGGLTKRTVPAATAEEFACVRAWVEIDLPALVQDDEFIKNLRSS